MNIVIGILAVINIIGGLLSAVPCLIIAGMSGDNPKAADSFTYAVIVWVFLSFPVICLLIGVVAPVLACMDFKMFALVLSCVPLIEASFIAVFVFVYSFITGT